MSKTGAAAVTQAKVADPTPIVANAIKSPRLIEQAQRRKKEVFTIVLTIYE